MGSCHFLCVPLPHKSHHIHACSCSNNNRPQLKSGTFSTVCRGVHRATGRQVAVKCILRKKIEPSVDAAVFEEVLIMSGLHHKYICPMIDYFEEDRCHFVVMELEKGGDLCERLNDKGTYSEDDARTVVKNICEAMEFVHGKGFAHCDIKPRNYLLRSKRDDVDVRLADFGFAQHVHAPNSLTSQCGTPFFVGKSLPCCFHSHSPWLPSIQAGLDLRDASPV